MMNQYESIIQHSFLVRSAYALQDLGGTSMPGYVTVPVGMFEAP